MPANRLTTELSEEVSVREMITVMPPQRCSSDWMLSLASRAVADPAAVAGEEIVAHGASDAVGDHVAGE